MAGLVALVFDKEQVNPALLREELTAALGPKFAGISRCGAALVESLRKPWADWTAADKDGFLRWLAGLGAGQHE